MGHRLNYILCLAVMLFVMDFIYTGVTYWQIPKLPSFFAVLTYLGVATLLFFCVETYNGGST